MAVPAPSTLVALRDWAAEQADPRAAMDGLGLILLDDLERWEYWCTPTNSVAFAATGGNGVHYSLVDVDDGIDEASPVVMTVPMQFDDPNRIVGADLREFLALGLRSGYFAFEGLAYGADFEADIAGTAEPGRQRMLDDLAARLDLRSWADVDSRLQALDEQFFDALVAPENLDAAEIR